MVEKKIFGMFNFHCSHTGCVSQDGVGHCVYVSSNFISSGGTV